MVSYKIIFGYLGLLVAFVGWLPYFWDVLRNKTKPHAFSWLVWSILTAIVFVSQLVEGGGAGSWITGFSTLLCTTVFLTALAKGDRTFILFDWLSLTFALVGLFFWKITNDPALSVMFVTCADALGFLPTIRKGYHKPHEETASMYAFTTVKWFFGFFALGSLSLATWLYPVYLIIANGSFVILLMWRRKKMALRKFSKE